jgi:hypothetical protein
LRANRQPPEEAPRQPHMVGENDPVSLGNHGRYIAIREGGDNEDDIDEKGAASGPLMSRGMAVAYSFASAVSGPAAPEASEMRAFLPRRPRR